MPIFMMYMMAFIKKFTVYGRWLDFIVGAASLSYGIYSNSYILMGFGALGILSFAINLNGIIQKKSLAFAHAKAVAKKKK